MRSAKPEIPPELVGQWIAYTRDRSKIVGSGSSFDAAKQAAAKNGCREVVIAKSASTTRRLAHCHLLPAVAVFISQAAETIADLGDLLQ